MAPTCPICDAAHAACVPSNPLYIVDLPTETRRPKVAELSLYEVPHRNGTITVKLSAEDAESLYGDTAKKIGDVQQAEAQPVATQPWAESVPEPGESEVKTEAKKAPARRNKAADADRS